jgi:hypothetical protein
MINILAWARGTAAAVTLSIAAAFTGPVMVTHAQAVGPVPANYVSVPGPGWTVMSPPDWTLVQLEPGTVQVKGQLPNGAPGAITVIKADVTPDVSAAQLSTAFQTSDGMKGAAFGNESDITYRNQPAHVVAYAGTGGAGQFISWIENNTGWIVVASVLSPDSSLVDAGLVTLGPVLASFSLT